MGTFGYEDKGGTATANYLNAYLTWFTLTENGTVTKLTIYLYNSHATIAYSIDVGIYDNARNLLGHLIKSIPALYDDWMDFDIADLVLPAGTYGLAFKLKSSAIYLNAYYAAGDANQCERDVLLAADNLPNPFTAEFLLDRKYSVYATYTPSAPPPPGGAGMSSGFLSLCLSFLGLGLKKKREKKKKRMFVILNP